MFDLKRGVAAVVRASHTWALFWSIHPATRMCAQVVGAPRHPLPTPRSTAPPPQAMTASPDGNAHLLSSRTETTCALVALLSSPATALPTAAAAVSTLAGGCFCCYHAQLACPRELQVPCSLAWLRVCCLPPCTTTCMPIRPPHAVKAGGLGLKAAISRLECLQAWWAQESRACWTRCLARHPKQWSRWPAAC